MRIAEIHIYRHGLPVHNGPYKMGHSEVGFLSTTLVKVVTDTGLDGWGESTPFGSTYIAAHARGTRPGIAEIAPSLLGRDPRQLDGTGWPHELRPSGQ